MFFKWVFKAFVAVYLVTHTFDITMAVFDMAPVSYTHLDVYKRQRIWRGKGFIPYPPKPRFYCVTNPKQRSYELWQFSEWNGTRATP